MRNVLCVCIVCELYLLCVLFFLSHPESTLLYSSSILFDSIILYLTLPYSLCAHFTDPYVLIFFFHFISPLSLCPFQHIIQTIFLIFLLKFFYFSCFAFFLNFFLRFFDFYSKAAIEGEERGIELNELFIF